MIEFTAETIAGFLGGEIVGNKEVKVHTVSSIEEGGEGSLTYLTNLKYEPYLYNTKASIVIVDKTFVPSKPVNATQIKVDNASSSILRLLEMYNAAKPRRTGISRLASVSEQATIGEGCYIGDFVVIEDGVTIGSNCQIYPQVYIGSGSSIGADTILYAGVKIYEGCHIANNCIFHSGVVIGADGFGFIPNAQGQLDKVPHLGNVIIEEYVELGANTCVDRAKTDSTIIHRGVKLDNLIQIGHNAQIGADTVMSAQGGVAGSSKVGHNCRLAGQVGISDHIVVGNNVSIGSKSGVEKDIADGLTRIGFPAMPRIQYHRVTALYKRLPELAQRIGELEKAINNKTK